METMRDDNVKIRKDETIKVYFADSRNFVRVTGDGTIVLHQNSGDNPDRKPGVYGLTWKELK